MSLQDTYPELISAQAVRARGGFGTVAFVHGQWGDEV
jgi:hypothetical protein